MLTNLGFRYFIQVYIIYCSIIYTVICLFVREIVKSYYYASCVGCDAPFTVRHFLLDCGDFAQVRNNCFHVDNMKQLFQDIHIDSIMTFLRQINLFNKI